MGNNTLNFRPLLRQKKRLFWLAVWCTTAYLLLTELRVYHQSQSHPDESSNSKVGLAKKETNSKLRQAIKFRSTSTDAKGAGLKANSGSKGTKNSKSSSNPQSEGYCSEKEYLEGAWVKRQKPLRDFKEVREAFGLQDLTELKCHAVDDAAPRLPKDPEYTARVLETAQYEWNTTNGCKKYAFDRMAFAKRCLRAKAGVTFIGDSLTEHTWHVITGLMVGSDELFWWDGTPDHNFRLMLRKDHPLAIPLLDAARVGHDRADTPLASFYRDHHVMSRDEMDAAFAGVQGYLPFKERSEEQLKVKWVFEETKWWRWWQEKFNTPIGYDLGKLLPQGPVRPEKSVLIFNVGPHWSRGELAADPEQMTFNAVADGYTKLVAGVLEKLRTLPRNEILAFWRAVSPGDPECEQYPEPVNNRTSHFSVNNPLAEQFNWNAYPEMNRHTSSRLSYQPSTSSVRLRPSPEPLRYLDVWPLSVTRPDAHLKPAIDCMHYCIPSAPNEWISFLWHLMVIDAANDDYIDQEPILPITAT